jgi:hypothetical protein
MFEGNFLERHRFGEPHPLVSPVRTETGGQPEVPPGDPPGYLGPERPLGVRQPRQRPVEKRLPQRHERPGAALLQRGRPLAVEVRGPH